MKQLKQKVEMVNERNCWLNKIVPNIKGYLRENEVKITKGSFHDVAGSLYKKHEKKMEETIEESEKPEELEYLFSLSYGQLRLKVRYFKNGIDIKRSPFLCSFNTSQVTERIPEYNILETDYTPSNLASKSEKIKQKKKAIRNLEDSISDLRSDIPSDIEWEEFYE